MTLRWRDFNVHADTFPSIELHTLDVSLDEPWMDMDTLDIIWAISSLIHTPTFLAVQLDHDWNQEGKGNNNFK